MLIKIRRNLQKGISLLEMLLVLAIIGVIAVMAVRYYAVANISQQVNDALDRVLAINSAGNRWLTTNTDFTNAKISEFTKRDYLPTYFNSLKNPWGGSYDANGSGSTLTVTIGNVTNSVVGKSLVGKVLAANIVCTSSDASYSGSTVTIIIKTSCS